MLRRLLPLLALAIASGPCLAATDQRHIDVTGHAERVVQPDRFTINITVKVSNAKPALARIGVEKHMATVITGFKAHHALPESINATALSITPHSHYKGNEEVVEGTEVTRTATATFARMDDLRDFIDSLDTAGNELQIAGTSIDRSDAPEIEAQLREEAMRDSTRQAELVAKTYGVRLGELFTVSDQATPVYEGYSGMSAAKQRPAPPPPIDLQVGGMKIERTMYATYLLAPSNK
ncbi:SIMPL domain-containing protein [Bacillus sp. NP157]|nr:SIMPL domain-containing protein [Bacillus sp. NP157]